MKNSIKFVLAAALVSLTSCQDTTRSTSSYTQVTNFELSNAQMYMVDGIMYAPYMSWDSIIYFYSSAEAENTGFKGGFILSNRLASDGATDEYAEYTSSNTNADIPTDNCYMVYYSTPYVPSPAIGFMFGSFSSASSGAMGMSISNTLYNKRMKDQGLISPGDYLKVTMDFYSGETLLASKSIDLVDYTESTLKMEEDWQDWYFTDSGTSSSSISIYGFNNIKINVEVVGEYLQPSFCMDNFIVTMDIVY